MSKLIKKFLSGIFIAGVIAMMPISQANAAVIVGDLTLADFGIPDLTTSNADLVYDFTAMCFDDGTDGGDGTNIGVCGTSTGGKPSDQLHFSGPLDEASSFGLLTVDGTSMTVDTGGPPELVTGTFSLTANFTGAGLFDAIGSSVSVDGSSTSFPGPDFLTADLTDFGFSGDGGSFELLFAATFTSGDFASNGTLGGVHIFNNTALGSWTSDWSSSGVEANTAVLNTAVVPVPAAAWLFGSGLLALAGVARRRS